jgi:gamma-glutamyltranspeptidase / glutathione hydrolase
VRIEGVRGSVADAVSAYRDRSAIETPRCGCWIPHAVHDIIAATHPLELARPPMSVPRRLLVPILLGVLAVLELPSAPFGPAIAGEYDRPGRNPHQSRSVVVAQHGMVATSHPLAAQAGLDVLKAGGTAADAAIATNAMLGLVEPMNCGIGGDLFVIYWDAKTEKLYGLNASGRSPKSLSREVFVQLELDEIPLEGPLSWSVPGCVDGWYELHGKFGKLPMERLLAESIQYGEEGFPVTEVIAGYWRSGKTAFAKHPDSQRTYLPDGKPPEEGDLFRNPHLAATYRLIAQQGRDAFYKGEIAETIDAFSTANGGYLRASDLAEHESTWIEPVSTNYRGYDVWELPPNGQGIAALQILNILEGYDLKAMGRSSADHLHAFVEAKKLAFADRAGFYADVDFADVPVRELISKAYAAGLRERIDMEAAAYDVPPGDPKLAHGDTIYLTVVDDERNCCSFIQSNYHGFGSKMTPGDLGFVLQNRGALFSLDPAHPNTLEPGKRPFHTIIPAMVTKVGKPWLSFGVMGGDMQPQGHAQILVNMIDFGLNVQMAGDAARVQHVGSATPTGRPLEPHGGAVAVESGVPAETLTELQRRGHRLIRAGGSFGGYQAIQIDWERGVLHGATESRKDGAVVGY